MRRLAMLCLIIFVSAPSARADGFRDCFLQQSDADVTIRGCSELIDAGNLPPQRLALAYTKRANAHAAKNDLDRAIADYTESIRHKEDALTYHSRGETYRKMGQLDRAIADFDKSIELNPKATYAFGARARAYQAKNDNDRAAADYHKILEIEPSNTTAWSIWKSLSSGICFTSKDAVAAVRACSAVITLAPQYKEPPEKVAELYFHRGFRFDQGGIADRAIADYTESIRLDPKNPRAYKMRAMLYWKGKQDRLAIADFSAVIELNPRDFDAYRGRGSLFLADAQFDRAIADYTKAIALKPQDGAILVQRGRAHEGKGDKPRAGLDYRKALEINPADERAQEALRRLGAGRN
jgi:tetratricopeptide (TPR) repeat protein